MGKAESQAPAQTYCQNLCLNRSHGGSRRTIKSEEDCLDPRMCLSAVFLLPYWCLNSAAPRTVLGHLNLLLGGAVGFWCMPMLPDREKSRCSPSEWQPGKWRTGAVQPCRAATLDRQLCFRAVSNRQLCSLLGGGGGRMVAKLIYGRVREKMKSFQKGQLQLQWKRTGVCAGIRMQTRACALTGQPPKQSSRGLINGQENHSDTRLSHDGFPQN